MTHAPPAPSGAQPSELFDVLIVGGGPAGLSAGIWLGRYLHSVALVDSGDPRNWETRGVNGFLGQPHVRPPELRRIGRDECRNYEVDLVDGCVDRGVKMDDDHFTLTLEDGRALRGRRLLLCFGIRDVWPDVPGLERVYGDKAHVCPDCDGFEARDKKTVVIGTGRKAVGMALNLATWTRDITPGPQLAIRAASDGAIAAIAIHKSLVPEERSLS